MASAGTPYRLVPAHFYPCQKSTAFGVMLSKTNQKIIRLYENNMVTYTFSSTLKKIKFINVINIHIMFVVTIKYNDYTNNVVMNVVVTYIHYSLKIAVQ